MIIPSGCLKRIHVNQHKIRSNRKCGQNDAVITVKSKFGNHYGNRVEIHGPSEVVYRADNPLSCGAHVWVETKAKVTIHD